MSHQVALNSIPSLENRLCPGCKQYAVNENGGLVVAFGHFFHVDCFKCAKCHQQVTADTNLLLLSDGSPICANCSYNCNVCHQPILDEAIMTGDDSYHAHCFNCKVCHNRIDELVFAKTSHGIYCMTCHNERMAKIRRHAQRKREREKAAEAIASSSTREREAREFLAENAIYDRPQAISPPSFRDTPSMRSLNQSREDALSVLERKRKSSPLQDESPQTSAQSSAQPSPRPIQHRLTSSRSSREAQSQSFSLTIAPPTTATMVIIVDDLGPSSPQVSSQSIPITPLESLQVQDGVEGTLLNPSSIADPSSALSRRRAMTTKGHAEKDSLDQLSLGVPNGVTSRRLALDYKKFMIRRSDSPPFFSDSLSSRRASNISLLRDNASGSTIYHSPPPSLLPGPIEATPDTRITFSSKFGEKPYEKLGQWHAHSAADVPHGIESGTDTEAEGDSSRKSSEDGPSPTVPAPPAKARANELKLDIDPDVGGRNTISQIARSDCRGSPALSSADGKSRSSEVRPIEPFLPHPDSRMIINEIPRILSQSLDTEAKDLLPNLPRDFSSRGRSSSDRIILSSQSWSEDERLDSNTSLDPTARIVRTWLPAIELDKNFVWTIITSMKQRRIEYGELKHKYDGTKGEPAIYWGLTVAQKEHDRELVARRNAEAEVTACVQNRSETRRQLSQDLAKKLDLLEHDLSHLKAERDMTLAELEELALQRSNNFSCPSVTNSGEIPAAQMSRSLTMRLDNIKMQYQHELIPLTQQHEALIREVAELKAAREQFLEETTVLNARNEELAQLSAQYVRRIETSRSATPTMDIISSKDESAANSVREKSTSFDREHPQSDFLSMSSSLNGLAAPSTTTLFSKASRPEIPDSMPSTLKSAKFKWPMGRGRDPSLSSIDQKGKGRVAHSFNQTSVLRFTRCDHCGDKLWGPICHISVHPRCVNQVAVACSQQPPRRDDAITQPPPSMFGRDLVEQRRVPVIVEKCIDAVEALDVSMDYEGIYRKTGAIRRGDYGAFDLRDEDQFNDICSVTSVLKTYFRQLPVPLLTYDLHGEFISAASLKDPGLKTQRLQELVNRLPSEHYHTLRLLVLHLHRVLAHSDKNLMNARNLGVVFGPTLMRSSDPGSEFSDMAGKAMMIEWLVDNAPSIFQSQISR
ncbi:hypothetical protein BDR07DRAFT_1396699 [Suillus spraguei]|nr:hypothetical protein BDR07DRAFT_1396699 [Suillus spraguei]